MVGTAPMALEISSAGRGFGRKREGPDDSIEHVGCVMQGSALYIDPYARPVHSTEPKVKRLGIAATLASNKRWAAAQSEADELPPTTTVEKSGFGKLD